MDQYSSMLSLLREEPPTPVRIPAKQILLTALAVCVLLAVTTLVGQHRQSPAERQYRLSAPALIQTLDELSNAQSPRAVRTIAASAGDELSAINNTLEQDSTVTGAQRLSTLRDAFVYVVALQDYDPADPSTWSENQDNLMAVLSDLRRHGGPTSNAEVAGRGAERTLAELTDSAAGVWS